LLTGSKMSTEERQLKAIVFTDICGFTELMGRNETKAMALLEQQRSLLKPIIKNFKGEWLKEIGDGVLIAFPSAVRAVTCALEIQRILAHNSDLTLRIGIHIGDVIKKDGDVFGDGVNVASRLEPLAEPGGICVSERVYDDIRNKPEISAAFQEEQMLKGVDRPIKVYSIFTQMSATTEPEKLKVTSKESKMPILAAGLSLGLLITIFALRTTDKMEPTVESIFYTGERIPVAISDFENNTGDATLDGLSGLLITSLEQSNYLTVLTRSRMYDLLKQMGKQDADKVDEQLGREICQRADINALVLTSIRQFGELYSVDLKILDIEKDEYLFSTNVQAEGKKNIPGLIDEISKQTRINLAEKAETIEKSQRDIASITTDNMEAYHHYDLGRKASLAFNWSDATKHYKNALEEDSTFALAYYGLAYNYKWNFDSRQYDFITKALKYIHSVPEKEQLFIQAMAVNDDQDAAIPIYKKVLEKYPNEKLAYWEIGDIYYHDDMADKSISYFEKCLEFDPAFEYALQHLYLAYVDTERHDNNIELANRAIELFPDEKLYKQRQLGAYRQAGKFKDYFRLAKKLEKSEFPILNPDKIIGDGYMYSGDYEKAEEHYLKMLANNEKEIDGLFSLKAHSMYRGDYKKYIQFSDHILQKCIENNWNQQYANELAQRAFVLVFIFDKRSDSGLILDELESFLSDKEKNIKFDNLGLFSRILLLDAYAYLGMWNKIDNEKLNSINFSQTNQKRYKAIKHQLNGDYQSSVRLLAKTTPSMNLDLQYFYYFHLGIDYRKLGDHKKSLIMFNKLKNSYGGAFGMRKYFHPILFLYAGLANLELKNYHQAKANIETFLKKWESTPEWVNYKKMARDAIKKIEKEVS